MKFLSTIAVFLIALMTVDAAPVARARVGGGNAARGAVAGAVANAHNFNGVRNFNNVNGVNGNFNHFFHRNRIAFYVNAGYAYNQALLLANADCGIGANFGANYGYNNFGANYTSPQFQDQVVEETYQPPPVTVRRILRTYTIEIPQYSYNAGFGYNAGIGCANVATPFYGFNNFNRSGFRGRFR